MTDVEPTVGACGICGSRRVLAAKGPCYVCGEVGVGGNLAAQQTAVLIRELRRVRGYAAVCAWVIGVWAVLSVVGAVLIVSNLHSTSP